MRSALLLLATASVASGIVTGIDMGHDTLKVSLVKPGQSFQIVSNVESKRKTPAMMAFYKEERFFGGHADALRGNKPANVVAEPHALLGRALSHPAVGHYANGSNYVALLEANERGGVDALLPSGALVAAAGESRFSAEELTAQLLAHTKDFTEAHAGSRVRDAVLTVPMYATQAERLSLIDAAEIAGYSVLGLLEENTAAGVHYGIDRVSENATHMMLLYNMGASGTQVTLFAYDAYTTLDRGTGGLGVKENKTVGQGRVVAKAWDTSLGGRFFDAALINYVADEFNKDKKMAKKLPAEARGDLRNVPSAMVKAAKSIIKAKEILSANENYVVFLEGVLPDVDFRVSLSRVLLDKIAGEAGLWNRVTKVIDDIFSQPGAGAASAVNAVELVGGGVRMPKVAALIKEYFATAAAAAAAAATPTPTPATSADANATAAAAAAAAIGPVVGTHMNGDESFALGAAFAAANRSAAFRVRKVGMVDAFPFAIGVRLAHLNPSDVTTAAPSTTEGDDAADGDAAPAAAPGKPWSKRSSLFRLYNSLDSTKRISFTSRNDLRATLFYENASATAPGPALPAGTARIISYVNVTGVDALMANATFAARGAPKVHLIFVLDTNGIATCTRAEATQDVEELVAEPTPKATPSPATNATNATASATASASAEASTAEPKMRLVKRTLKFPLKVALDTIGALPVQPLSAADKVAVQTRLRTLRAADDAKRAIEGAKNALEAFVYATRDKVEAAGDDMSDIATTAQREELSEALSTETDWLSDDGPNTELATYKSRLLTLRGISDPIFSRLEEHKARPDAIAAARKAVTGASSVVTKWSTTHPQINANETADALSTISNFTAWLDAAVAAQAALKGHEEPTLTRALLDAKLTPMKDFIARLSRKPRPTPTPAPVPKVKTNSTGARNGTNGTNSSSGSGEEEGEVDEEAAPATDEGGAGYDAEDGEEAPAPEGAAGGDAEADSDADADEL